ncbi:MAG: hypothetical protein ACK5PZ_13120, partial [Pirellula sp.]
MKKWILSLVVSSTCVGYAMAQPPGGDDQPPRQGEFGRGPGGPEGRGPGGPEGRGPGGPEGRGPGGPEGRGPG